MTREYVAVMERGDGRDEIVNSCTASSRQAAEAKMDPQGLYVVMTQKQAEARGLLDLRETTRFCGR